MEGVIELYFVGSLDTIRQAIRQIFADLQSYYFNTSQNAGANALREDCKANGSWVSNNQTCKLNTYTNGSDKPTVEDITIVLRRLTRYLLSDAQSSPVLYTYKQSWDKTWRLFSWRT